MTDKEVRSGEADIVQKQTKEALQESENKYRLLIENSHDIIYALDLQGFFTFASPSWKRILGQNNDAVVGHRFHEFVHPDDIPRCEKFLASLLETPEPLLSIEYRVRNVEGEWRWYSSNAAPVINADGTCTSFVGIASDVTERKRAEERLASQYALLQAIINSSGDVIVFSLDAQYCYTAFNDKHRREMKKVWSVDVQIGMNMLDCMNIPEFRALAKQSMDRALRGESFLEEQYQANLDIYYEFNWSTVMQGKDVVGVAVFTRDVTSRKQMEVALLQARDDWESTFDSLTDMVTIHDKNYDIIRANSSARQMLGLPLLGNLITKAKCFMCYHGTEKPPEGCPSCRSLVTEQPGSFELFEPHLNRYLEIRAIPRFDTHHQCIGLVHVVRDITERKQAEEEILRERAFFDQLIETSPEGIAITNTQGRVTRVNAEFLRMFGYGVDEAVGQDIDDLVAPPALDAEAREMTTSSSHGETKFLETVRRRKDGTLVDVSVIAAPVLIAGKQEANYAIYRDITERKQMEQKLEEMATHDFLTGLPNRALLLDRFTIAAALARRNKSRLAVISLDLDKFKSVNDTLGHDAGDQVLKTIGIRLTRIVRASDTFARVGGDEFISVMLGTSRIEDASVMAQKILDSFREPVSVGEHQLHLSTSIGIAIYPDDGDNLETLTKKSDAAMYYSKGHGGNQLKFYRDGDAY